MRTLEDRIADSVETMEELISVLDAETEALTRHDQETVGQLQPRKAALSDVYGRDSAFIGKKAGDVRDLGPEWVEALAETSKRVESAIKANMRALDVGRAAAQRMFSIIRESARRTQGTVDTYTGGARAAGDTGRRCLSVTFDGTV